jgi:hypothetical protein
VIVEWEIVRLLISETPWLPTQVPMPEPNPEPIASICESEIKTHRMDDPEPSLQPPIPVPMAELPEPVALIVDLKIVRLSTSEDPDLQYPAPIAGLYPEAVATTRESEIKRHPIDNLALSSHEEPVPIPAPSELLDTTVEFQIVMQPILETPWSSHLPVPRPEPSEPSAAIEEW